MGLAEDLENVVSLSEQPALTVAALMSHLSLQDPTLEVRLFMGRDWRTAAVVSTGLDLVNKQTHEIEFGHECHARTCVLLVVDPSTFKRRSP